MAAILGRVAPTPKETTVAATIPAAETVEGMRAAKSPAMVATAATARTLAPETRAASRVRATMAGTAGRTPAMETATGTTPMPAAVTAMPTVATARTLAPGARAASRVRATMAGTAGETPSTAAAAAAETTPTLVAPTAMVKATTPTPVAVTAMPTLVATPTIPDWAMGPTRAKARST